ncbi:hypothetical protein PI124_g19700 [Phytophthora idaei]|nr:hypothetical protein PI125_g9043 [Phytophthora idaei]KAG3132350.1 hypothetical protein PI126_g19682 [Phytophthora idaei]KAG3235263.1 hypothetical protein PI124_g19700 [Phytophthora idaei]
MQQLFKQICYQHPPEFLAPGRRRYPELTEGEMKVLVQLFLMDIKEGQQDARKWNARLQTLTRAIYKSRSSLTETLDVLVKSVQAQPTLVANPWSQRLFPAQYAGTEDVEMTEGTALIYRFLQSAYSTEQIAELRHTCTFVLVHIVIVCTKDCCYTAQWTTM